MKKQLIAILLAWPFTYEYAMGSYNATTYDVAIIGSGPAGLTAGAYAARAQLKTVIIEGDMPGGQLMKTTTIENWPGETSIPACQLIAKMTEGACKHGCSFLSQTIASIDFTARPFVLNTNAGSSIQAKSIIIATGSSLKKLNCPGEEEYFGKGIAACAVCDAPFYQDQEVIIVGTGNPALAEVEHLTHYAKKITVIEIKDAITAKDKKRAEIFKHPKVTIKFNTTLEKIMGDGNKVTAAVIKNLKTNETSTISVDGIFVCIGFTPNNSLVKNAVELWPSGHIKLVKNTQTSIPGVFAAGNIADPVYQQAITCAGSGCMAALDAQRFLVGNDLTFQDIARHWRQQESGRCKKA